jgi:hypothetical protein
VLSVRRPCVGIEQPGFPRAKYPDTFKIKPPKRPCYPLLPRDSQGHQTAASMRLCDNQKAKPGRRGEGRKRTGGRAATAAQTRCQRGPKETDHGPRTTDHGPRRSKEQRSCSCGSCVPLGCLGPRPGRGLTLWLRGLSQGWVKCEDRLPYYRDSSCSLPLAMTPRPRLRDSRGPRRQRGRPGSRARSSGALAASMQREGAVPDSFVQNKMTRASHLWTK